MKQAATQILEDWRGHTLQQLCDGFKLLLNNIGATLVDFASKTENIELQNGFFDAQHTIEKQRDQLLAEFRRRLQQAESGNIDSGPVIGSETLSLLERDAYERSVALETIANNCILRNQQNYHALKQRVSALYGGRRFEIDNLPLNPREVSHNFEATVATLEVSSKVRLVLFTLFERYVMKRLDDALSDINRQLAEAGVLPTIKYKVSASQASASTPARGRTGKQAPNAAMQAPAAGKGTAPASTGKEPADPLMEAKGPAAEPPTAEQTMDAIKQLVSARRRRQRYTEFSGEAPSKASVAPQESRRRALEALNSPQYTREAKDSPAVGVLTDQSNKIVVDKELLFRVRNTLKKQRALINSLTGDGRSIAEREQNAIEVVGMLFEAMLDDQTLPDQLKALLSHLHTPFLKIALKDPECLSDTQHPARRLLGNMLQLGLRWVNPERLRSGIYPTLQYCVRSIIDAPETVDYRALEDELERKVAQLEQTRKVSEQRTLDAEKGQTMLSRARETAESATRALLDSRALPAPVHIFFKTVFTDFLSLLLLRNDLNPKHPKCREALNVAVQLIENVDAGQVTAAQEAGTSLKELIQVLLPHYENKIEMFLHNLEHTITSVDREKPHMQEAARSTHGGAEAEVDEATAAKILEIPAGSWFQLQEDPDEQAMMVKLLWSNPHTQHVLFVDQHGLKRAHLSLAEVASRINKGTLKPVDIKSEGVLGKLLSSIRRRLESNLATGADS